VPGLLGRDNRKGHQGFADQASVPIDHFAIHYACASPLTYYARVRPDFSILDGFEKIDFHFDGDDARAHGRGQEGRESPSRIGQHRQNPAVNDVMDLLVQLKHRHAEHRPAALGLFQHESKVIDGVAMAQTFRSPRQCRFAQFSPWFHLLPPFAVSQQTLQEWPEKRVTSYRSPASNPEYVWRSGI
jgi:hypothetical protein